MSMKDEKTSGGRRVIRWALALIGVLVVCGVIAAIMGALAGDGDAEPEVAQVQRGAAEEIAAEVTATDSGESQPTDLPQPTLPPTDTPAPTNTPEPTTTPLPTATPRPTATPQPTATIAPPPEPVLLSGSGDDIVDFAGFPDSALMGVHIVGSGSSNFAVWNLDAAGEPIDLLVNEIGRYEGRHLVGISDLEAPTAGFEINANGPWTIEVFPFDPAYVDRIETPGEFEGVGDNFFVVLNNAGTNRATITHDGSSNFAVWRLSDDGYDLLINEIGAYEGTVRTGSAAVMIIIVNADGTWQVDMSGQ
jgi:hypothetical protein